MESTIQLKLSEIPRNEKLKLWLKIQNKSLRSIAQKVGLSQSTVAQHCANDTMPTRLYQHFISLGADPELLPEPLDRRPGPKPREG